MEDYVEQLKGIYEALDYDIRSSVANGNLSLLISFEGIANSDGSQTIVPRLEIKPA